MQHAAEIGAGASRRRATGAGTSAGPPRGSCSTSGRVTTTPKRGRSGRRVSAKTQSSSRRATQATSSASRVPQSEGKARLAAAETKPAAKVSTGRRFRTQAAVLLAEARAVVELVAAHGAALGGDLEDEPALAHRREELAGELEPLLRVDDRRTRRRTRRAARATPRTRPADARPSPRPRARRRPSGRGRASGGGTGR